MCNFVISRAPQKNVHEDLKLNIQDCIKLYAKICFFGCATDKSFRTELGQVAALWWELQYWCTQLFELKFHSQKNDLSWEQ